MPESYIHGGTDVREIERLEKQADFAAPFILRDFQAAKGERVLDLATGVGAMAEQVARRCPGIRLVGVDLNRSQLLAAQRRHPIAFYAQADGAQLPFAERTFHKVHCSWMLEHVREPVRVLREVRRVLALGGTCHFTEVDNATFRTVPEFPEIVRAMAALNRAQIEGGGDPYIGRTLESLFLAAGFEHAEVKPAPLYGNATHLAFFRAFAEEFAEIFESLDEALPSEADTLRAAAARLRGLPSTPGTEMHYTSVVGRATR